MKLMDKQNNDGGTTKSKKKQNRVRDPSKNRSAYPLKGAVAVILVAKSYMVLRDAG